MAADFVNSRVPGCQVVPYPSLRKQAAYVFCCNGVYMINALFFCNFILCFLNWCNIDTLRKFKILMNLFTDVSSISKHSLACNWAVIYCYEEIVASSSFFCWCSCTEFHIIVCGLDSIIARRWMNGMLVRGALKR